MLAQLWNPYLPVSRVTASLSSAVATRGSQPQSPESTVGFAGDVCQQTATMKRSRLTTEPKTHFSGHSENEFVRLRSDKIKCPKKRKTLPGCLGWERFVETWRPCTLIYLDVEGPRRARMLLFERHGEYFPDISVPLLYLPKTLGGKTSRSLSLGHCWMAGQTIRSSRRALEICPRGTRWQNGLGLSLGYTLTVHSSHAVF